MATLTFQLSDAEHKLLQSLVYRECGMWFDSKRAHFLHDRLQRRLKASGADSFYTYYRLVTSDQGRGELATLVETLTINETSFFRNKPQLELFQRRILEPVLEHKQARRDFSLRVWSAGCSTGQEAYTLAMQISETLSFYSLRHPLPMDAVFPRPLVPPPWRVEILASDISYSELRVAQQGVYTLAQMEPVDYSYRLRFFDRSGDKYIVKKALREMVHFDFHNLKSEFLPQRNDIIFCRNVMIYFDEPEQRRLVDKLYRCLNPESHLFIGHAESLLSITDRFRIIHHNSGTAYQRVEVES